MAINLVKSSVSITYDGEILSVGNFPKLKSKYLNSHFEFEYFIRGVGNKDLSLLMHKIYENSCVKYNGIEKVELLGEWRVSGVQKKVPTSSFEKSFFVIKLRVFFNNGEGIFLKLEDILDTSIIQNIKNVYYVDNYPFFNHLHYNLK